MPFKKVTLNTNDVALSRGWDTLVSWITRRIEAMVVNNGSGDTILRGHVLIMSDDREVTLADASAEPGTHFVGVAVENAPDGDPFIVRNDNVAFVLFTDAPANGDDAFISDTAGLASNLSGSVTMRIGVVVDASPFAELGGAFVILNKVCTPVIG